MKLSHGVHITNPPLIWNVIDVEIFAHNHISRVVISRALGERIALRSGTGITVQPIKRTSIYTLVCTVKRSHLLMEGGLLPSTQSFAIDESNLALCPREDLAAVGHRCHQVNPILVPHTLRATICEYESLLRRTSTRG